MINVIYKFFLVRYLTNPKQVGSLIQSSKFLSKSISSLIDELEDVHIIEIGPGKGSITKHLNSNKLTLVEIDRFFIDHLRLKFPLIPIYNMCAVDFLNQIHDEVGLIISIPLINNPIKLKLISTLKKLYLNKKIKWCVIYTYGSKSPLAEVGFFRQIRVKRVYLNIPPAYIWLYK